MIGLGFVLLFAVALSAPFTANALSSERRKVTVMAVEASLLVAAFFLITCGGS